MSESAVHFPSSRGFSIAGQSRPVRRTRPTSETTPASDPDILPVLTSMGARLQTHPNCTNPCWDDLDAIEQSLLVVASRERMLDQACPAWADRPRHDGAIELTKQAALGLLHRGLIGFFRVSVGYPDLSENDLGLVFRGRSYWDCDDENSRQVGLFLTTAGEDVVLGP